MITPYIVENHSKEWFVEQIKIVNDLDKSLALESSMIESNVNQEHKPLTATTHEQAVSETALSKDGGWGIHDENDW